MVTAEAFFTSGLVPSEAAALIPHLSEPVLDMDSCINKIKLQRRLCTVSIQQQKLNLEEQQPLRSPALR